MYNDKSKVGYCTFNEKMFTKKHCICGEIVKVNV